MTKPGFTATHSIEAEVQAATIWGLFEDIDSWPRWIPGARAATRHGPFAAGTTGVVELVDRAPVSSTLVSVEPGREFVDEAAVGGTVVRVSHLIEPLGPDTTRVTFAVEVTGARDEAQAISHALAGDFPAVMGALVAVAGERAR